MLLKITFFRVFEKVEHVEWGVRRDTGPFLVCDVRRVACGDAGEHAGTGWLRIGFVCFLYGLNRGFLGVREGFLWELYT